MGSNQARGRGWPCVSMEHGGQLLVSSLGSLWGRARPLHLAQTCTSHHRWVSEEGEREGGATLVGLLLEVRFSLQEG